jgi:transposase
MPKRTIITRKVDVDCIKKFLHKEARRRIRERLLALLWVYEGEDAQDVAKKIGRCRQTVASHIRLFNEQGLPGLVHIGRGPGRQSLLTRKQRKALLSWVVKGPRAMGYSFNLWDCKKLACHIHKKWGISISDERVRQILHELGARVLRPKHKLPEVDQELRCKKNNKSRPFWRLPGRDLRG